MSSSLRDALLKAGLKETKVQKPQRPQKTFKPQQQGAQKPYIPASAQAQKLQEKKQEARQETRHEARHETRHESKPAFEKRSDRPTRSDLPTVRTSCGCCHKPGPDVEFYLHVRRGLSARWLCTVCADKYQVPDECRQTDQSDLSKRRLFRREFGRTKRFGFVHDMAELRDRIDSFDRGDDVSSNDSKGRALTAHQDSEDRHRHRVQQQEKLVHEGLLHQHLKSKEFQPSSRGGRWQGAAGERDRGHDRGHRQNHNHDYDQRRRNDFDRRENGQSEVKTENKAEVKADVADVKNLKNEEKKD